MSALAILGAALAAVAIGVVGAVLTDRGFWQWILLGERR